MGSIQNNLKMQALGLSTNEFGNFKSDLAGLIIIASLSLCQLLAVQLKLLVKLPIVVARALSE